MASSPEDSGPSALEYEDDKCLEALNQTEAKEEVEAIQTALSLSEEERKAHYDEAVRQLNEMLSKAEQFNATCEKLASESPFLAKSKPADFVGGDLRDYQQAGVEWMSTKHWLGESGIIADEMGLGKTVQIIAYVAWMRAKPVQDGPVLIVVPLSTLRNWINEFQRFAPSIPVLEYHGTPPERAALRRRHIPGCPAWAAEESKKRGQTQAARRHAVASMAREDRCSMPVFVTTYSIAMNDSALLGKAVVPWGLLVVDESHRLKNSASKLTAELEAYCWMGELGGTQKIILTGTPLQNDLTELWSLCHFVMPLIFADKEAFRSVYGFLQLGTAAGRDEVVRKQERDHIISTLHRLLARYMLRRTKADVDLKLPPKVEVVVYCGMTEIQSRLASALVSGTLASTIRDMGWFLTPGDSAVGRLVKGAAAAPAASSCSSEADPVASGPISNLQMHLRKISNHPFLFAEPHPPPITESAADLAGREARAAAAKVSWVKTVQVTAEEMAELAMASSSDGGDDDDDDDDDDDAGAGERADRSRWPGRPAVQASTRPRRSAAAAVLPAAASSSSRRPKRTVFAACKGAAAAVGLPVAAPRVQEEHITDDSIVSSCSKMQVLDTMLRRLKAQGHKVLIFSQFARTLEILCDYMELRGAEFGPYEHLDGSTPREDRQEAMDRFNTDPDTFCFLLSTRAGGLGINLTGADTVIIYDSDWNPHADSQAEDRAHRIGQTRPVVVYRLVTAGSVEEGLVHRANSKRALERVVLQEGKWLREREDADSEVATPATAPAPHAEDLASNAAKRDRSPSAALSQAAAAVTPSGKRGRRAAAEPKPGRDHIERTEMRRWLREDLESTGVGHPIGDCELEAVLDRAAVLAAGAQVLTRVEGDAAAKKLGFTPEQLRAAAAEAGRPSGSSSTTSPPDAAAIRRIPARGAGYEVTYHSVSALKSIAQFAISEAVSVPAPEASVTAASRKPSRAPSKLTVPAKGSSSFSRSSRRRR